MTSSSQPTIIGLIRHARTQWNMEKRIQGSTDKPLCEEGQQDAKAWGISLAVEQQVGPAPWQRIICSSLTRAQQTAAAINIPLNLPLSIHPMLREQDWGEWEGYTIKELRQALDGEVERQEARNWHFTPTGGESRATVRDRMFTALTQLAKQYAGQRILIVTHLSCIKTVVHALLEQQGLPTEPDPLQKHGLHQLSFTDNTFSILHLNGDL